MLHTGSLLPHLGWNSTPWGATPRSALLCDKYLPENDTLLVGAWH